MIALAIAIPFLTDADGVIRLAETRVTLDRVIAAFHEGATAEEIAQQYSSLRLADVYSVIGYYLDHKTEVDHYLNDRGQRSTLVPRENEKRFDPNGVRERLIARRERQG